MKRKDCLEAYQDYSRQTSDNVRKLSFAAIAIIWVFKAQTQGGSVTISPILVWSGISVVIALVFDFIQYTYGTIAWGSFHRQKELSGVLPNGEFKAPVWINWPTNTFFTIKVLSVGVGYVLLLIFLGRIVTFG